MLSGRDRVRASVRLVVRGLGRRHLDLGIVQIRGVGLVRGLVWEAVLEWGLCRGAVLLRLLRRRNNRVTDFILGGRESGRWCVGGLCVRAGPRRRGGRGRSSFCRRRVGRSRRV
jgi:hypothetical protein